jgi:phosphatidylglycerophosphate synthase
MVAALIEALRAPKTGACSRGSESGPDLGWPLEPWTVELLLELRRWDYTPAAWSRFLANSWSRAQDTARRERALVQAWRRLTLAIAAGSALPLALTWRRHDAKKARRLGRMLALGLALQQADAYVHLGLNRRLSDGLLLPDLGLATSLTYLRGTLACWQLAGTLAGTDSPALAPGMLAIGTITDILDGMIARRQQRTTKLGTYADGEADAVLALAVTAAAVRRQTLPARVCWLLGLRYLLPIGVGLAVAITRGRPPRLGHSLLGQLCGLAQAGLLGCALAPRPLQRLSARPRRALLPVVGILDVLYGLAQSLRMLHEGEHGERVSTLTEPGRSPGLQ